MLYKINDYKKAADFENRQKKIMSHLKNQTKGTILRLVQNAAIPNFGIVDIVVIAATTYKVSHKQT